MLVDILHAPLTWSLIAGILAVASGAFIGDFAYQTMRRKQRAASVLAKGRRNQILLKLQGGFKPLRGVSGWMLDRLQALDEACDCAVILMEERGIAFTKEAILSLLIACSLGAFALGWILSRSLTFGIAACLAIFIGVLAIARNRSDKRSASMREDVPEALRNLSMSFRSGHSLPQTLAESAKDSNGYLGHLFKVAADRLEMGDSPQDALAVMRGNPHVPELSFVAVALDVQHQSGGSIAPVLESAMESVENSLKLERSLRVQTAQAKLSASVVTVMPFILVALFSLMSPDFLSPFFSSVLGMAVLALAIAMQVTGIFVVRRMLKVEAF